MQSIVGTADLSSNQEITVRGKRMRDQKTFEEHLDEVREDSNGNPMKKRINRLDNIPEEQGNKPLYSYSLPARIGFGVVVAIISFILLSIVTSSPALSLFLLPAPLFVFTITASKIGIALRRELPKAVKAIIEKSQQQQQAGATQSQPEEIVCQNCGWKNPKLNNYCHDCGNEI